MATALNIAVFGDDEQQGSPTLEVLEQASARAFVAADAAAARGGDLVLLAHEVGEGEGGGKRVWKCSRGARENAATPSIGFLGGSGEASPSRRSLSLFRSHNPRALSRHHSPDRDHTHPGRKPPTHCARSSNFRRRPAPRPSSVREVAAVANSWRRAFAAAMQRPRASNGGDSCLIRQGGQVFRRKPAIRKRFSQGARMQQLRPR